MPPEDPMPSNFEKSALWFATVIFLAAVYTGGFTSMIQRHPGVGKLGTGTVVHTVPDTIGHRVIALVYMPMAAITGHELHPENTTSTLPR